MNLIKQFKKEEDGSATLEFLGIMPVALLLLVIIVQIVVGINAVLITQSAANEAASVYSVTGDAREASLAADKIIDATGDYLMGSASFTHQSSKNFTAKVKVNIKLTFLPDSIGSYNFPLVPYTATASSRVIE